MCSQYSVLEVNHPYSMLPWDLETVKILPKTKIAVVAYPISGNISCISSESKRSERGA